MSLKIVQLEAENFKRLKAVEVTPDGNLVTISGNNGEGKSSLLDAIWVGLLGRSVAPPEPIRKGEEVCLIELNLGQLKVTRKFTRKDDGDYTDTLKVEDPEGLRYPRPQTVLDELLGELGFDPFAFVMMKPKDQATALRKIVPLDIDLDELAEQDKRIFDTRRDKNRDIKRLEGELAGYPNEKRIDVPDAAVLRNQLQAAAATNTQNAEMRLKRDGIRQRHAQRAGLIADMEEKLADLKSQQDQADREIKGWEQYPVPADVDTAEVSRQLEEADKAMQINAMVERREKVEAELKEAREFAQDYTARLAKNEQLRRDALAKAKFPVEGLAFKIEDGDQIITFNDVPFEQASMAEKLRVSTAIAMNANPKLRVLRIMDGSLLDDNSMKLLEDMAKEHDFQLWVERVGKGATGIVIEDGAIVGQTIEPKAKKEPKPVPAEPSEAKKPVDIADQNELSYD